MKRSHIIAMLWAIWICSIIGMVFGVYSYIDAKRVKLRSEIRENIEKAFEDLGISDGNNCIDGIDSVLTS